MSHTPGPWEFYSDPEEWGDPDEAWRIKAQNSQSIFDTLLSNTRYYPSCPDKIEDWLLIAAAPELLEACEEALGVFDSAPIQYSRDFVRVVGLLRHVIAKAIGK